jgi:UDP-N-acetyl-D-mannosaminuronic acid transferase (WecB/TagA/CpsF family)
MPSGVALISDMPAWVSLMGLEWLYGILQKLGLQHKAK